MDWSRFAYELPSKTVLLKGREKRREEECEDVSSYWMTLKEMRRCWKLKEDTLDGTVCRTGFKGAMDLSFD